MKLFLGMIAALLAGVAQAQVAPPANTTMENGSPRANTPIVQAAPMRSYSTPAGGSVTTGGTFKTAIPANGRRLGCLLQNTSATNMQVYVGPAASATGATALNLPANATFSCAQSSGLVILDEIAVTSATAGSTYVTVVQ